MSEDLYYIQVPGSWQIHCGIDVFLWWAINPGVWTADLREARKLSRCGIDAIFALGVRGVPHRCSDVDSLGHQFVSREFERTLKELREVHPISTIDLTHLGSVLSRLENLERETAELRKLVHRLKFYAEVGG